MTWEISSVFNQSQSSTQVDFIFETMVAFFINRLEDFWLSLFFYLNKLFEKLKPLRAIIQIRPNSCSKGVIDTR